MELIVEDHRNSVVLRRAEDLPRTTLEDLVGCAGYVGPSRQLGGEDGSRDRPRRAGTLVIALGTNVIVRLVTADDSGSAPSGPGHLPQSLPASWRFLWIPG